MKKSELWIGVVALLLGAACMAAQLLPVPQGLRGFLWGFAGAGMTMGVMSIWRYVYWTRPENAPRYQARLEREAIELKDELKESVRNKAGCLAYRAGILAVCLSMLVFSVLDGLEVLDSKVIVLYLFGYLVFQLVFGNWVFKRLMKRY